MSLHGGSSQKKYGKGRSTGARGGDSNRKQDANSVPFDNSSVPRTVGSVADDLAGLSFEGPGDRDAPLGGRQSAQAPRYSTTPTQSTSTARAGPSSGAQLPSAQARHPPNRNYDMNNYTLRPYKFYNTAGRVIVVIWSEPAREGLGPSTQHIRQGAQGLPVLQKPRFFIVLRAYQQSCMAIAINTHEQRGVVYLPHKGNYGIAFQDHADSFPLPGEEGMQQVPIRILPDLNADRLLPRSRINYGKVYTIEYNIGVRAFGMIPKEFLAPLYAQFSAVTGVQIPVPGAAPVVNTPSAVSTTPRVAVAPTADSIRANIARLTSEGGLSVPDAWAAVRRHLATQGFNMDQILTGRTSSAAPQAGDSQGELGAARLQMRAILDRLVTEGGLTLEAARAALQQHLATQGRAMPLGAAVPEEDDEDDEEAEEDEEDDELDVAVVPTIGGHYTATPRAPLVVTGRGQPHHNTGAVSNVGARSGMTASGAVSGLAAPRTVSVEELQIMHANLMATRQIDAAQATSIVRQMLDSGQIQVAPQ